MGGPSASHHPRVFIMCYILYKSIAVCMLFILFLYTKTNYCSFISLYIGLIHFCQLGVMSVSGVSFLLTFVLGNLNATNKCN